MHTSSLLAVAVATLACLPTTFSSPTSAVSTDTKPVKKRGTNYTMTQFSVNATDGGNQGVLYNMQIGFVDQTCTLVNVRERDQIYDPQIAFNCGSNPKVFAYLLGGRALRPQDSKGKTPDNTVSSIGFVYSIGDGNIQTVQVGNIFNYKDITCNTNNNGPPFTCGLKDGHGGIAAHQAPITSSPKVCS